MRQRSDYPTFSDSEIATTSQGHLPSSWTDEGVDALLFYGTGRYSSDIYWLTDWPSSREAYVLFQTGKEPVVFMQLFNHYPDGAGDVDRSRMCAGPGPIPATASWSLFRERGLESKKIGLVGSISLSSLQQVT